MLPNQEMAKHLLLELNDDILYNLNLDSKEYLMKQNVSGLVLLLLIYIFLVVLGLNFRVFRLLGRCSTT
jgi:hypothetical protein